MRAVLVCLLKRPCLHIAMRRSSKMMGGAQMGDWNCAACGAMVFGSKNACYKCHTPRPGGMPGGGGGGGGYGNDGFALRIRPSTLPLAARGSYPQACWAARST